MFHSNILPGPDASLGPLDLVPGAPMIPCGLWWIKRLRHSPA